MVRQSRKLVKRKLSWKCYKVRCKRETITKVLDSINDAYKLTFTIQNEGTYSTAFNSKDNTFRNMRHFDRVIITGYCPDKITLGFKNKFDTVNPFAIGSSNLVQAGFQLFTGHSSVHRVNNISVWQGSEPLSMTVKLQLFATNNKQHVNINNKNISTHTKGISPQDLLDIIMCN